MTPWSEEIILNELNSGKVNPIRWFIKLGKKKEEKKTFTRSNPKFKQKR